MKSFMQKWLKVFTNCAASIKLKQKKIEFYVCKQGLNGPILRILKDPTGFDATYRNAQYFQGHTKDLKY
jgi:hypothetical protein